jgi:hypothetical protein
VATLLIQGSPEFHDCDLKTVPEVIKDTLHEVCIDKGIFNSDDVIFSRKATLFDCISASVAVGFGIKLTHFESGFSFQIDPHEPAKLSEFSCAFKFHCGSIRNRKSGSIFHGIQHSHLYGGHQLAVFLIEVL